MAETINTATPDYIVEGVLTDGESWVPLITNILDATASEIIFESTTGANEWSQYMDLVMIIYGRANHSASYRNINISFNDDTTAANYTSQYYVGDGGGGSSTGYSTYAGYYYGWVPAHSTTDAIYGAGMITFYDINSGKRKSSNSWTANDAAGSGAVYLGSNAWENTPAITKIKFECQSGDTHEDTRIDLFGVLPRMVTA